MEELRRVLGRATRPIALSVAWLALGAASACGSGETHDRPTMVVAGSASGAGDGGGSASTMPGAGDGGALDSGVDPSGGVDPTSGGMDATSGGMDATSGGMDATSGGMDATSGGMDAGGTVGTAGSGGTAVGGTVGTAGSGGTPPLLPGTGVGSLGRSCSGPRDCSVGLTCVTQNHQVLAGAAPPHGFCSWPCTNNEECSQRSPNAMCFPFAPGGSASFCVEGCSFGTPDIGATKCHGRADFACNPALLIPGVDACDTTEDCAQDDLCVDGFCNAVLPGCLPSCRGDLDCAPGLYCDQSFLSGTCTPKKPTGKRLGEPCTVPTAQEPDEPDECLGFCQADDNSGSSGHCAATCGLARECAWDPGSGKFDGLCMYGTVLTTEKADVGDFGFCTPACSCSDPCADPSLACTVLSGIGPLSSEDFRGPGLCFSKDPTTTPLCEAGGAGAGGFGGAP